MRPILLVAGLLGATTALTVDPHQSEGDIASFEVERGRGIEKRQDGERDNRRNRSPRRDDDRSGSESEEEDNEEKKGKEVKWKPKTKNPHFFNLVVDYDDCDFYDPNGDCPWWWPFCHKHNKRLGKRQGGPGGPGGPGAGPGGPGALGGVLGGVLGGPGGLAGGPGGPGGAPGGPGILGGPGGPGGGSGGPGILGGPGGPGGGSGGPGVLGGPGGPGGGPRGPGVLDGVLGGPGGPGVLGGVLGGPGGPGGGPRGPDIQGGPGALGSPGSVQTEGEELSAKNGRKGRGYCEWKLKNYVIVLNYGKVLAVPYKPWFRGKLATFFVDDDTRLFTVSKQPLSIYVDRIDAQLLYTNVGWLPPNAAATGFYQLGTNPERKIPSPAYLTWPITYGLAFPEWVLCEIGSTGHYEIFANPQNWRSNEPQGLLKADQFEECFAAPLATFNTNPWKGN